MSLPITAEPLPSSYNFGKVTGRVIHLIADTAEDTDDKPQARAAAGKVTFKPKEVLRKTTDTDYPAIVLHAPETATLSSSGRILDAEGRQGIWLAVGVYTVTFEVNKAPRAIPDFDIQVTAEHTDAAPLDLASVVPYVPPSGTFVQTVLIPSGGTEGQVLVRAADGGLVWANQTSGGGTGGAVESVNGETGAVALDATDIGAQPAGDYATSTQLSDGLATKVNSSTYTAGMADKQDKATLGADVAADPTVRAAFLPREEYKGGGSGRVAFPSGRGAVCFVWDDGYSDHHTVRLMADERGQRHTFGINSGLLGNFNRMTPAQVLEAHEAGHEIANHTVNHINLATADLATRISEVDDCSAALRGITGVSPETFIFPNGGRTDAIDQELYLRFRRIRRTTSPAGFQGLSRYTAGDRGAFLVGSQTWSDSHNLVLELIRNAAATDTVVSFYAHAFGGGAPGGEPTLAQVTEAMDLAQSLGVPCVTLAEAFPGHAAVLDPGFETYPLGDVAWFPYTNGSGIAEIVTDTPDAGLSGTKSLRLSVPTGSGFAYAVQTIPVLPNRTYTLSGRCRVAGTPASGVQLRVRQRDYLGGFIGSPSYSAAQTSTTWGRFSMDVTTGQTATALVLEPLVNAVAAEAWWDHLHVGPKNLGAFG